MNTIRTSLTDYDHPAPANCHEQHGVLSGIAAAEPSSAPRRDNSSSGSVADGLRVQQIGVPTKSKTILLHDFQFCESCYSGFCTHRVYVSVE